jgi:outer membrane protein
MLWGQAPNAAASAGKVGVINIQLAIGNTSEGRKAFDELQRKYQPRQQELQRLQSEIAAIQDQLQRQAATLSDEEQRRLSRDLEEKQKVQKRSTEDANADFTADRDEAVRRIGGKMIRLINEYAQQNGYVLVIDSGQIPVYYATNDLTEEMVKRYDAANPVADTGPGTVAKPRPASTSPKPAAPTAKAPIKPQS